MAARMIKFGINIETASTQFMIICYEANRNTRAFAEKSYFTNTG